MDFDFSIYAVTYLELRLFVKIKEKLIKANTFTKKKQEKMLYQYHVIA